jgi:hypothetical protein
MNTSGINKHPGCCLAPCWFAYMFLIPGRLGQPPAAHIFRPTEAAYWDHQGAGCISRVMGNFGNEAKKKKGEEKECESQWTHQEV